MQVQGAVAGARFSAATLDTWRTRDVRTLGTPHRCQRPGDLEIEGGLPEPKRLADSFLSHQCVPIRMGMTSGARD